MGKEISWCSDVPEPIPSVPQRCPLRNAECVETIWKYFPRTKPHAAVHAVIPKIAGPNHVINGVHMLKNAKRQITHPIIVFFLT